MATTSETLLPDALTGLSNLTGALTDVDEGTDSPDGNFLIAGVAGTDTSATFGFPAPTVSTQIEGTQTFRVYARKDATGGGAPDVTAIVQQDGATVATVITNAGFTVETGEVFTGTVDAASFTDLTGANVTLIVNGLSAGGGPNQRTVEPGAAQWEATLTLKRIIFYT